MSHEWSALLDQVTHRMQMTYHPTIGHLHVPNLVARLPHERGGYYSRTNAQGFRSDTDFETERSGRLRILVFGDSFTAGQGCDNHERYSECLGRKLGAEVYNYGVSGTAPDQQLLIYEEIASDVEADLIIWGIALHNIERIQMTHRPSRDRVTGQPILMPKPYFVLDDDELRVNHVPVPRVRPELKSGEEHGYLDEQGDTGLSIAVQAARFLRMLGAGAQPVKHRLRGLLYRATDVQMYDDYRDENSEGWKLLAALIRRFKASARDTPLLVVPLPTYHYYVDKLKPIYDRLFETLQDVGQGLHVLSLTRTLVEGRSLAERLGYCFEHDGHYSPRGHAAVAQIIASAIRQRGLLPPVREDSMPRARDPEAPTNLVLGLVSSPTSATALLADGRVLASAPEDPFWPAGRRPDFPVRSANYCLEEARVHQPELTAGVYVGSAGTMQPNPNPKDGFTAAWRTPSKSSGLERLGSANPLRSALNHGGPAYFASHGLAQCASAFYGSPFEVAAVLSIHESIDGTVASIAIGSGHDLRVISEVRGGTGLEAAARRVAKLVGLSGDDALLELGLLARTPSREDVSAVETDFLQVGAEGAFTVPDWSESSARSTFGLAEENVSASRRGEVAGAFITVVRDCVRKMVEHAHRVAARDELCLVSAAVHETSVFDDVKRSHGKSWTLYRPAHFGSVSAAIGAARLFWHRDEDGARHKDEDLRSAVGPAFSSDEIQAFLDTHDFPFRILDDASIPGVIAGLLAEGGRVGYFAGRISGRSRRNARAVLLGVVDAEDQPSTVAFGGQLRAVRRWESGEVGDSLQVIESGVGWIPLQLAGEGVALTPFDAYRCLMLGSLDWLLLQGYLVSRVEQPRWPSDAGRPGSDEEQGYEDT